MKTKLAVVLCVVALIAAACKPWSGVVKEAHYNSVNAMSFSWGQIRFQTFSDCQIDWHNGGSVAWWCLQPLYGDYQYMHDLEYLNYSTDGCSGLLPDVTPAWDFTAPCRQHDFCYRNWPEVNAHYGGGLNMSSIRLHCDERFLNNMEDRCQHSGLLEGYCLDVAAIVYSGVRVGGSMGSSRL